GDEESAENIDRGERDGEDAHRFAQAGVRQGGGEHGAHDDDGRNGIGHRHQRRVQGGGDVPDHVVADVDGQHEDDEVDDGVVDEFHYLFLNTRWASHTMQAATISSSRWMAGLPSLSMTSFRNS